MNRENGQALRHSILRRISNTTNWTEEAGSGNAAVVEFPDIANGAQAGAAAVEFPDIANGAEAGAAAAEFPDIANSPEPDAAAVEFPDIANAAKATSDDIVKEALEKIKENPGETKCSICYGLMINPVETNCKHRFCEYCLLQWSRKVWKGINCPMCRTVLANVTYMSGLKALIDQELVGKLDEEEQKEWKTEEEDRERKRDQLAVFIGLGEPFEVLFDSSPSLVRLHAKLAYCLGANVPIDHVARYIHPFYELED